MYAHPRLLRHLTRPPPLRVKRMKTQKRKSRSKYKPASAFESAFGWYYHSLNDDEHEPEGPFDTHEECKREAKADGYKVVITEDVYRG